MAYTAKNLNNIAGSIGRANVWVYTDADVDPSDMDADDYFAGANDYGMKVGDLIFLSGASGECILGCVTEITATASTISALTAVGS